MLNTYGAGNANKIVVVFHRLGPYHFARLRALDKVSELLVIQAVGLDSTYAWDVIADSHGLNIKTLFSDDNELEKVCAKTTMAEIDTCLKGYLPDAIAVSGWSSKESLAMMSWCNRNSIPVIMMSDSTLHDTSRKWYKEKVKSLLIRMASSFLVGGKPQAEYVELLGASPGTIFNGYDVVDNSHFAKSQATIAKGIQLGFSLERQTGNIFLTCCRFIHKKNLFRLLDAFKLYLLQEDSKKYHESGKFIILGDGELKEKIDFLQYSTGNN